MRPLGDVISDLEVLITEMVVDHDLQWGDMLAILHNHLVIHQPDAQEVYEEGGDSPTFYYGPKKQRA